jgi:hypothetical protein
MNPRRVAGLAALAAAGIMLAAARIASGHDPSGHNEYANWFTTQKQYSGKAFCCGDLNQRGGDAHYVSVKTEEGQYFVWVDEQWVLYPHPVNPNLLNPTGRNVVWYKKVDGPNVPEYRFYCLRLATGS